MESAPKKNRRKLSRFLCREMLYDYVSDNLDADRRTAIREYLDSDEQTREELECLQEGLALCETLSRTAVSQPLIDKLKKNQSISAEALSRVSWSRLPAPMRIGIEAMAVSVTVAVVMSSIPWGKLTLFRPQRGRQVEITQVEHQTNGEKDRQQLEAQSAQMAAVHPDATDTQAPISPLSQAAPASTTGPASTPVAEAKPPVVEPSIAPPTQAVAAAPPPEVKVSPSTQKVDVPLPGRESAIPPSAAIGSEATEQNPDTLELPQDANRRIFKLFMRLGNLDKVSKDVAEALRTQGAERAGEVDLGWRRSTGSYYHFTLPQTNYKASIKALQSFGPVRIFLEPRGRKVPGDKIRIILWIEEQK